MKVFTMGNAYKEKSYIDAVGEKNRNRKEYAKQHRKRENVPYIVPVRNDCNRFRLPHIRPLRVRT